MPLSIQKTLPGPPDPIILSTPGAIRFRVLADDGQCSNTWMIKGARNTDDIYIGITRQMGHVKLSLHRNTWRMALTSEAGAEHVPVGLDRLIQRWSPSDSIGGGWRVPVIIAIPHDALGFMRASASSEPLSSWPSVPVPGRAWFFILCVGEPGHSNATFNYAHEKGPAAEVGRMELRNGTAVLLLAQNLEAEAAFNWNVRKMRREALQATGYRYYHDVRMWAWGGKTGGSTGAVTLLDLGDPWREGYLRPLPPAPPGVLQATALTQLFPPLGIMGRKLKTEQQG